MLVVREIPSSKQEKIAIGRYKGRGGITHHRERYMQSLQARAGKGARRHAPHHKTIWAPAPKNISRDHTIDSEEQGSMSNLTSRCTVMRCPLTMERGGVTETCSRRPPTLDSMFESDALQGSSAFKGTTRSRSEAAGAHFAQRVAGQETRTPRR